MRENLDACIRMMFGSEGGYVNNPKDPGGPTKYGITWKTLRAYRGLSAAKKPSQADIDAVKALTLDTAEAIYRANYWTQAGGDMLPAGLDYMAFDFGVNSGPATAVKKLQAVLGAKVDASVGVETISAANAYPGGISALIDAYAKARLSFMRGLSGWKTFGPGWTARVKKVAEQAKAMANPGAPVGPVDVPVTDAAPVPVAKAEAKPENILSSPEARGFVVSMVTGAAGWSGMLSGSGPFQWALAILSLGGGALALYYLYRRIEHPA